jgi:hypothetical protein
MYIDHGYLEGIFVIWRFREYFDHFGSLNDFIFYFFGVWRFFFFDILEVSMVFKIL